MKKILIVEDHSCTAFLIQQLVQQALNGDVEIAHAETLEDAIPQVSWSDLVISDYMFPTEGFLGLLPILQAEKKPFILQTASIDCLKTYDSDLQIATILKGVSYAKNMLNTIKNIS